MHVHSTLRAKSLVSWLSAWFYTNPEPSYYYHGTFMVVLRTMLWWSPRMLRMHCPVPKNLCKSCSTSAWPQARFIRGVTGLRGLAWVPKHVGQLRVALEMYSPENDRILQKIRTSGPGAPAPAERTAGVLEPQGASPVATRGLACVTTRPHSIKLQVIYSRQNDRIAGRSVVFARQCAPPGRITHRAMTR